MTDPVLSCHFLISFPSVPGGPFNSVTGLPDCTSAANRTSSNRTGSLLDRKTAKAQHCDSHVSCHDLFEALCQSLHSQEKWNDEDQDWDEFPWNVHSKRHEETSICRVALGIAKILETCKNVFSKKKSPRHRGFTRKPTADTAEELFSSLDSLPLESARYIKLWGFIFTKVQQIPQVIWPQPQDIRFLGFSRKKPPPCSISCTRPVPHQKLDDLQAFGSLVCFFWGGWGWSFFHTIFNLSNKVEPKLKIHPKLMNFGVEEGRKIQPFYF